ncbi:lipoprotein NlpD [Candidatus Burkholderia brachyanthoides]|nr:lipoprotein NlpD [Candidatus Burkholderia brachyanthoides]
MLVLNRTGGFGLRLGAAGAGMKLAAVAAGVTAALAGCTFTPRTPAPIVESSAQSALPVVQGTAPGVTPAQVTPLGPMSSSLATPAPALAPVQPGFYRVMPGDTLFGIARQFKQKPDDLKKWNTLPESRQVNIGQVLRLAPPGSAVASTASLSSSSKMEQPPLLGTPGKSASSATPSAAEKSAADKSADKSSSSETKSAGKGSFVWPMHGDVVRKFGSSGNKGIDIAGKVGTPVKAAASGKVVYAGNGLRSYGRMIIVKHPNDYLTAYAYNEKLLVKEGDSVKQGTTIADMGTGPSGSPALHFEVRKAGTAVDPMPLLGAGG